MIICPKCGITEDKRNFIGPFCDKCYEFEIKLPKKLEITHCKRCNKIRLGGVWMPYNKEKIQDYVAGRFKGDLEKVDYYLDSGTAIFSIMKDGKIYNIERHFEVKFDLVNCKNCNKQSGGYFEAIIQLRGNKGAVERWSKIFHRTLNNTTYVSKVKEIKEGIDLYVGSTRAVIAVLKEAGIRYNISRKLHTRKEGKNLYRTSFAIRFE